MKWELEMRMPVDLTFEGNAFSCAASFPERRKPCEARRRAGGCNEIEM
jgi:hypothetical protein